MGAVRARYDERVVPGALTGDAAQAEAASRLDGLASTIGYLTRGKRAFMMLALLAPPVVIIGRRAVSSTKAAEA